MEGAIGPTDLERGGLFHCVKLPIPSKAYQRADEKPGAPGRGESLRYWREISRAERETSTGARFTKTAAETTFGIIPVSDTSAHFFRLKLWEISGLFRL